jgi:phosphoglycolate phosphatase
MRDEKQSKSIVNNLGKESMKLLAEESTEISSLRPHPSSLKILLWDIDGTLMSSVQHGSFRNYFAPVMKQVFGTSGKLEELQVSGMTDFQIFYESLLHEGFTVESVREKLPELLEVFPLEMQRVVDGEKTHKLFGGVKEILQATKENPKFINALLTGNLTPAARIKIGIFGLERYFDFSISAFGENSHDRNDLGFVAVQKAREKFDYNFNPSQFIIIGDTPKDIACARTCGAKVISVATGRNHPSEELAEFNPDVLLEDLTDTAQVLQILESL